MTARIINRDGTVEEMSDAAFYERVFGHPPITREQREAEHRANCERFADMIAAGGGWGVPPPCLAAAQAIVAERAEQITEPVEGDPLLKHDRRHAA